MNLIENEVRACKKRTMKIFHTPDRAFVLPGRSMLCKIHSEREVVKEFARNLSEKEVSVMDITEKI